MIRKCTVFGVLKKWKKKRMGKSIKSCMQVKEKKKKKDKIMANKC